MADLKTLSAQKREAFGKGNNRRLRIQGQVPGVFYTPGGENISVQTDAKALAKMYQEVGRTTVFDLEMTADGKTMKHPVLFWDIMRDPCRENITHVDFYGVDLNKAVKVTVPVYFKGVARGTKVGGTLETYREKMVLLAKPLEMPASVTVDISTLDVNSTIHVGEIELPAGVTAVFESNYAMVAVIMETEDDGATDL